MDKSKGFNYKSNTNIHLPSKEHDVMEADLKTMANNVINNRLKSHNQLQNFYMPYLKKAFEDSRSTNPSLKSPQQLIFSSKLFEMKQTEDKLQINLFKREIQSKNSKILKLENKVKVLEQNLLVFNRSNVIEMRVQQPYTNLKRMQEYMFIKNDEYLFRIKLRVNSLLEDFNIHKSDLSLIDTKRTETQLLDYILEKLKPLADDYRDLKSTNYQRRNELQNKYIRLQYENKQLEQSLQLISNNQRNLKQQLEHVKQNWNNSNTKIIYLERQVQQKDNENYKLKKLLQQKHENIKNINKQTQNRLSLETHLRIDNEKQANDMAVLLQSSYVDNLQLKEKLQQKQFEYEQLKVAYQFNIEQLQRINRMNITLKARYEPQQNKTAGFSYSPKAIHEQTFLNKFNKKLSEDYVTISKQKQATNQTLNKIRTTHYKLPLERIVQLRKGIDQKEHQLWRLQTKLSNNMVFSRENNPQIQKIQHQIQIMKTELYKLQTEISSRTKNI